MPARGPGPSSGNPPAVSNRLNSPDKDFPAMRQTKGNSAPFSNQFRANNSVICLSIRHSTSLWPGCRWAKVGTTGLHRPNALAKLCAEQMMPKISPLIGQKAVRHQRAGWDALLALVTALLWLALPATTSAADFTVSLDRDTISVGESTMLTLKFEDGSPSSVPAVAPVSGLRINYASHSTSINADLNTGEAFPSSPLFTQLRRNMKTRKLPFLLYR